MSSYLEVRQQTLDRETEIALGIRQLPIRAAEEVTAEIDIAIASDIVKAKESELAIGPDSWSKKIPKLIWRGVPMVEVRHVSRILPIGQYRISTLMMLIGTIARIRRSSLVGCQVVGLGQSER